MALKNYQAILKAKKAKQNKGKMKASDYDDIVNSRPAEVGKNGSTSKNNWDKWDKDHKKK